VRRSVNQPTNQPIRTDIRAQLLHIPVEWKLRVHDSEVHLVTRE